MEQSLGVVELRQYTLYPGRRDALIRLFDQQLVLPQENAGIRVLGQFRDLDDPDRFVWLRGFPRMSVRPAALAEFYGGPVWARHRDSANATMLDSDDVLLLRPLPGLPAFPDDAAPPPSRQPDGRPLVGVTVHRLRERPPVECVVRFAGAVEPLLATAGGIVVAHLETEPAENNFPALPVREGEQVLVRVARFPDVAAHAAAQRAVVGSAAWRDFRSFVDGAPREIRLQPTERSLLR